MCIKSKKYHFKPDFQSCSFRLDFNSTDSLKNAKFVRYI